MNLVPLRDTVSGTNFVGFKDGVGNIETLSSVFMKMGDRFACLGGLPAAEVCAAAYKTLATPVYSSAVFNLIRKTAMDFFKAVAADDLQPHEMEALAELITKLGPH